MKLRVKRLLLFLVVPVFAFGFQLSAFSANWSGVDESVVEKIAEEHGRPAKEPIINTDQGDLLLFLFLAAGAAGGGVAGYNWRKLMENRRDTGQQSPRLVKKG